MATVRDYLIEEIKMETGSSTKEGFRDFILKMLNHATDRRQMSERLELVEAALAPNTLITAAEWLALPARMSLSRPQAIKRGLKPIETVLS
jgi:hypothetical protein